MEAQSIKYEFDSNEPPSKQECTEARDAILEINSQDFYLHEYDAIISGENYKFQYETIIDAMYWAFTTFTSVGFGDRRPFSDLERLLCAFIFMFGTSI